MQEDFVQYIKVGSNRCTGLLDIVLLDACRWTLRSCLTCLKMEQCIPSLAGLVTRKLLSILHDKHIWIADSPVHRDLVRVWRFVRRHFPRSEQLFSWKQKHRVWKEESCWTVFRYNYYYKIIWVSLLSSVVRVLDALNLNMEHKARNFESICLAALFLLNNFQYVLKTFSQWVSGWHDYNSDDAIIYLLGMNSCVVYWRKPFLT